MFTGQDPRPAGGPATVAATKEGSWELGHAEYVSNSSKNTKILFLRYLSTLKIYFSVSFPKLDG